MITRRTLLASGAALAAAQWLAGCSDQNAPGGTNASTGPLTVRLPGTQVGYPSPFGYGGGTGYLQASYVYDTLLWKDGTGAYVPWLAERHERADDGRSYTFTLRSGVTWSDGKPLTAADVAFTFDYLRTYRAQIAPNVISLPPFDSLARAEAVDDRTVRFTLTEPDWTFEQFTGAGGIFIMPKHVWEGIDQPGKQTDPKLLVGTGPYRVESMNPAEGSYLYTAREDYFLGRPVVTRIEHLPAGKPLEALLAGQLDYAGGVGPGTGLRPQALAPFRGNRDFRVIDAPLGHTVTALYWNLAKGGPLGDVDFRRACAYAIDRAAMTKTLFGETGGPGNPGLIPPGNPFHAPVEQYAHDVARAEDLLDRAGYRRGAGGVREGNGVKLSFELLTSSAQQAGPVDLVVADLAKVGIEARPVSVDLPTFGQRRTAGQTELSINTFGGTNTDEQPDGMGKVYASATRSLQRALGYRNEEFDRLWKQQRATLDAAARKPMAQRMQQIVATDLPVLPLFYPPLTTIVRASRFDGWFDTPGGVGGLVPSVANKLALVTGGPRMPR